MLVTIERVERKQGKNGGAYHVVHLGEGRKVYCWDGKLAGELVPGAVYEVEVRDGQFPKLTAARQVTTLNGTDAQADADTGEHNGASPNFGVEATAAEREAALRLAMSAIGQVRPQDVPAVIEAARQILAWLKGGEG